jgi:lauroyl/myristoyl acyltransferase
MQEDRKRKPDLFFSLIEYLLLTLFHLTRLLSYIAPPSLLDAMFAGLGSIIFYSWPGMRRRLEGKISDAMPEVFDRRETRDIGRQACGAILRPILDLVLMSRYGHRFMSELRIEGLDNLKRADAVGKGVILVGAHQGANALRIATMARLGKAYTPIYLTPEDSPVSRYYMTLASFGKPLGCDPECPVLWTGQDTVRKTREHLSKGKRVGIDFDVEGRCAVRFFGREAALADGIAQFSVDTGAPVVPFALLHGKGSFGHRLVFYEAITVRSKGTRARDVKTIMTEVAKTGESMIREAPGQWMSWFGIRRLWEKAEGLEGKGSSGYRQTAVGAGDHGAGR